MYYVLLLIIGQSIEYGVKQALITARLCVENAFQHMLVCVTMCLMMAPFLLELLLTPLISIEWMAYLMNDRTCMPHLILNTTGYCHIVLD